MVRRTRLQLCTEKLHEVAKYLILDGHVKNFTTWVVSADWFHSLTDEQQGWVLDSFKEAGEYNNEVQQAADADYLQKMKDEGVTVVDPSEDVLKAFKEKAQPFYDLGSEFGWSDGLLRYSQRRLWALNKNIDSKGNSRSVFSLVLSGKRRRIRNYPGSSFFVSYFNKSRIFSAASPAVPVF